MGFFSSQVNKYGKKAIMAGFKPVNPPKKIKKPKQVISLSQQDQQNLELFMQIIGNTYPVTLKMMYNRINCFDHTVDVYKIQFDFTGLTPTEKSIFRQESIDLLLNSTESDVLSLIDFRGKTLTIHLILD